MAALSLLGSGQVAAQEDMETVLVTGEQPGPGLWKVSRDGHVMWVLGSVGAVPDTFVWRTHEVEARIAESQEVLFPGWPRVDLDVGVFEALTLVPAVFKAAKNPDGATLKDVLSPGDYATWLRLRQKYLGDDDDLERYRPMVAEEKLNNAIGKKAMKGLRMTAVDAVIRKLAKQHKVRIHQLPSVVRKIEVEKPRAILKAAKKLDLAEGECVGRNFVRLEKADAKGLLAFDVASINAWATGDLDAMRAQAQAVSDPDLAREDCTTAALDAVLESHSAEAYGEARRGVDLIKQQADLQAQASAEAERNWVEAAEKALADNTSTFAVLPMSLVTNEWVYLGKLKRKGYRIEAPNERGSPSGTENAGPSLQGRPASG
ncbi:MAG TPA: TraB/GumN family protein [Steroidobacteraceae bacterium]|nr:TraB/GumN family protein [Steroidobacteraceae bacterium]